ncbi:MAG: thiamine-phosphate kinase [Polyangiaceae bacterium]|nr:thiamine-phosphate kinase [Polyangiaceae bacterium]
MTADRGSPAAKRGRRVGEFEAIGLLRSLLAPGRQPGIAVGIGDDAAVLNGRRSRLVWTVDACVQDVHFDLRWLSLEDVGWRSFQAAASDLAGMGATPLGALSALVLPNWFGAREIGALGRGQAEASVELGCPVVGGNITRGTELSITTTVLGEADAVLLRSGARVGDQVWLVGDVGLAAAGLELLRANALERRGARGQQARAGAAAREVCLRAWRRPQALLRRGRALAACASAAIDVSDGLCGDAHQLAASSGVRVVIEAPALAGGLRPELASAASVLGESALHLALRGGEDYSLLATGDARQRPRWARRIGRVEEGVGAVLEDPSAGRVIPLRQGFDHLVPTGGAGVIPKLRRVRRT